MHIVPKSYGAAPNEKRAKSRKVMRPPSISSSSSKVIRWWFAEATYRPFWIWLALLILTGILFTISKPPAVSPLIVAYLDVLHEQSSWALPEISAQAGNTFWLSMLFIVFLCLFLAATFFYSLGSYVGPSPKPKSRLTRYFGTTNLQRYPRAKWFGGALFLLMLLSNLTLFFYYHQRLQYPEQPPTGSGFEAVYFLAIISRLLGGFFGIGIVLVLFFQDFWKQITAFFKNCIGYFYPPLITVGIMAVVFSQMDQIDSLFIELMDSAGNFAIFSLLLFPASIAIVWFSPTYLAFTDRAFADRRKSWDILRQIRKDDDTFPATYKIYGWILLHKRLFLELDRLPKQSPPPQFMRQQEKPQVSIPKTAFDRFRMFLGFAYILVLVSICTDIYYGNQPTPSTVGSFLVPGIALAALAYVIVSLWQSNVAFATKNAVLRRYPSRPKQISRFSLTALTDRARQKRNEQNQAKFETDTTVYYVKSTVTYWIGVGFTWLTLLLFLFVTVMILLEGFRWHDSFRLFLFFLASSVFLFLWLAVFQPFYQQRTFNKNKRQHRRPSDKALDRLDALSTQIMLLVNPVMATLGLAFFLTGLFWEGFVSSSFVEFLNPLNIYLLLSNSFIAGIIIIDRFIMLWNRKREFERTVLQQSENRSWSKISITSYVWGFAIIALILAMNYLGNEYHGIPYHQADATTAIVLDEYVENFANDQDTSKPLIFVAADGGGLKACYWTMLNLYQLDSLGLFDGQVFAMSGASGGTIGVSMYTYLKARGKSYSEILKITKKIGDRNFLSGDFAGLLTRFPINYWPDIPMVDPSEWDDRMESMARAYFDIVGEGDPKYAYEAIRKQPFWYPWIDNEQLPLLIINSARAEDGLLGTVTPLKDNPLSGSIDLTHTVNRGYISYPDATFLSNRFPVASPAARIVGKGHFLDAGSVDNSGINSIYGLIRTLKSRELASPPGDSTNVYQKLAKRKVVVISLRNAASRYIRDQFLEVRDSMNRFFYQSEFSANLGVAVNSGLTGVPISWDDYLRAPVVQDLGLVDEFLAINLPFRLREGDITASLGGEIRYPTLNQRRRALNAMINDRLGKDSTFAVMPPLARVLAYPVRDYMEMMLQHPQVKEVYDKLEE